MSEHTPLTEAERELLSSLCDIDAPRGAGSDGYCYHHHAPVKWAGHANADEVCCIQVEDYAEQLLAARTSTATERRHADEVAGREYPGHACPEHGPRCVGPTCCCRDLHAPTATADTGPIEDQDRERLVNGLVKQHREDGAATADTGLRERVEAKMRDCLRLSGTAMDPEVREWTAAFGKDLKAILDATPASTEDRADNEGTR